MRKGGKRRSRAKWLPKVTVKVGNGDALEQHLSAEY